LFDINFQPRQMSVAQLQSGFVDLARRLYSAEETADRRGRFKARLRTSPNFRKSRHPDNSAKLAA
jgi:hypothetical protein